ncbi:hypothetical protein RCJ22_31185, partial [Vibrio sp. FNV 38]|nr:hypothetical protein [Vibrio sp. FNV 38]
MGLFFDFYNNYSYINSEDTELDCETKLFYINRTSSRIGEAVSNDKNNDLINVLIDAKKSYEST